MNLRNLILPGLVVFVAGCQPAEQPAESATPAEPAATSSAAPSDSGGGIAPMATPVPNAPVTGTESLQGGGSAAGTIAKDRAKGVAAKASGSSLGSEMGSE